MSRSPTSASISALFKVRDAFEPLRVHMGHQQSNRVSSVSKCFDGGVTWCGARAQTAAISARASTSRRLHQRPLPRSDAVYTVYHGRHGGRCRCGDSSVTLRGGHVRHFLSVQRSSLRSGSSVTRISKVFGQRFASFHRCLLRRHVKELHSGLAVLVPPPGPGLSSARLTRHPHPPR